MDDLDDLLPYYRRELDYLRRAGEAFAARHPAIAHQLHLDAGDQAEPDLERLIESFALLAGRLQRDIDNASGEMPEMLLSLLCPHAVKSVPSFAVARFGLDTARVGPAGGRRIDAGTPVSAESPDAAPCHFQTCYPLTLWPLRLSDATVSEAGLGDLMDAAALLRLRFTATAGDLSGLGLSQLRFHLAGDRSSAFDLYELLCEHLQGIAVAGPGVPLRMLPHADVRPVGFGAAESLFPGLPASDPAYALARDYVLFPAKFLFLDVAGLELPAAGDRFELLFLLDRAPKPDTVVSPESFLLGCTPVVNLFEAPAAPVLVDHTVADYSLNVEGVPHRAAEVHTVLEISKSADFSDPDAAVAPYISRDGRHGTGRDSAFWITRQRWSPRPDLPGTETLMAFVDAVLDPAEPADSTVYARLLCTSRGLAADLAAGTELRLAGEPGVQARLLTPPTAQIDPPLGSDQLWRLVASLSLANSCFADDAALLRSLKTVLTVTRDVDGRGAMLADSLVDLRMSEAVRRIGEGHARGQSWRGFCRGLEISLSIDEGRIAGDSSYLFGAVLARIVAAYAPPNLYTQVSARDVRAPNSEWHQWQAMIGNQIVR